MAKKKNMKASIRKDLIEGQFNDSEVAVQEVPMAESTSREEEIPIVERSTPEEVSSSETVPQTPRRSPYVEAPIQLLIGPDETVFHVPRHLLPQDWSKTGEEERFSLSDVNNETGHTLVHYLYTKSYETLAAEASACSKFEQALLVYIMTAHYDLPVELEELSIREIENHGSQLSFFETLAEIERHFSKLDEKSRIHAYLLKRAREAFESNYAIFRTEAFIESIGGAELHKFMMTSAIELYHEKVSRMMDKETESKQNFVLHNGLVQGEPVEDDVLEQSVKGPEHSTSTQHDSLYSDDFCTISCPSSECPVDVPSECPVDIPLEETVSTEQHSVPDLSVQDLLAKVAIEVPTQDVGLDVLRMDTQDNTARTAMLELEPKLEPEPEPVPAVDPFAGLSKSQKKKLQERMKKEAKEAANKAYEDERLRIEADAIEQCSAPDLSAPELILEGAMTNPVSMPNDDPIARQMLMIQQ